MKIEYIKCKACKNTFGTKGFASHLAGSHGLTTKQYYDKYLKKKNEGQCLNCGKETAFISITKGYKKYCCIKCCNASDVHKKQTIASCLKRYGVENPGQLNKKIKIEKPTKENKTKEKVFKNRNYKNKQLPSTEWRYLCNDVYNVYKNVGKGIIKFFDKDYVVTKNIPKLKEKYRKLYKGKKQVFIKNSSPEKLLAICSLNKVYATNDLNELEVSIIRKLRIDNKVISRTNVYWNGCKCAICGDIVKKIASHLYNSHKNVNHKEYYDNYLKKPNEGKCVVCGKTTNFLDMEQGYSEYCCDKCSRIMQVKKANKTFLKKYGFTRASKNKKVKDKTIKTNLKKYGVKYVFQAEEIKNKIFKTNLKKYGVKCVTQNKKIQKKIAKTNIKVYGVPCVFQSEEIKNKIRTTNRLNCGYDYWHQMPGFQEVVKKNNLENWGVEYPNQTKENRKRMSERINDEKDFANRRKKYKGCLSSSETIFKEYLNKLGFDFKVGYRIKNHTFDFAIFKNNKLDCLIEIDGELYHGLITDIGNPSDYTRYSKVPKGVKLVVIDSLQLGFGIREVMRVVDMKYDEWKKELLSYIPKEIEYPKFSDTFLKRNWSYLSDKDKNVDIKYTWINSNIGKSIVIHFCPEYAYRKLNYKSIRKDLFISPFSSKNYLEGKECLDNIPKLMIKFKDYKNKVIVKKHSPEKMIAVCALGKTYLSKESFDGGTKNIIKYFNLKAYEA